MSSLVKILLLKCVKTTFDCTHYEYKRKYKIRQPIGTHCSNKIHFLPLFISRSIGPYRDLTICANCRTDVISPMSRCSKRSLCSPIKAWGIFAANPFRAISTFRTPKTTVNLHWSSFSTTWNPIPRLPPVTTAFLPSWLAISESHRSLENPIKILPWQFFLTHSIPPSI